MKPRCVLSHWSRLLVASLLFIATVFIATVMAEVPSANAQSDGRRQTVAVTYPLDQTINLQFRGTTRLPRLSGEAKVKRTGRRGSRVELSVENLPRALELGGVYTTYVLWAISPEGRTDNLGEIKRGGSVLVNSKVDVTTPLQTFAMIVTAEPHFLVRGPSRMVVLENLPPRETGDAVGIALVNVQYTGNTSDYFNESRVPEVAEKDYVNTPTSLLGARQAINLARYVGAERDATKELAEATAQLEAAENAWRLKQPEAEIDQAARRTISLGARAEEVAEARRAARLRREDVARRDEAVRTAEETTATISKEVADLRTKLAREERAREIAERDVASASQQVRDLRSEVGRLREELGTGRREAEEAKLKLARLEGEKSAEDARRAGEQQAAAQREATLALKQNLARYGTVSESAQGFVLILPESLWATPRGAEFAKAATTVIEPLAGLLANNPNYRIQVETFTDNRGDSFALQKLTEERAQKLAARFVEAGVDAARVQASGMGTAKPLASNSKPSGRLRNRRTEIMLVPVNVAPTTTTTTTTTTTAVTTATGSNN